ncbi:flippase [Lachnospiraceae bacterium 45-P1]
MSGSIKKNFLMNSLLTLSSFIYPIITFPYVSRILLPTGTGKVAFATSFVSYFLMLSQLGIPTYGIRACAKVSDDRVKLSRVVHELFTINLFMSFISYGGLAICIAYFPKINLEKNLIIIISSSILLNTIGIEWLYKGLELYSYITLRSVVFKIIALIGMFLIVHKEQDYVIYGGITVFASSASFVLNFINSKKYVLWKNVGGYSLKQHYKIILVFFAMACATTVYTNLDAVMLGFMTTDADVGFYNAAVKIKTILVALVSSLGAVLLPRSSYLVENSQMQEFKTISKKAIQFVLLVSMPLTVFFMIFAPEGIRFLSGESYNNSIIPMIIIMPSIIFIGLSNILGIQVLVPLGREKIVLKSVIVGAVVDLILNTLFIPLYKSSGAAIGTLLAEFCVLLVQYLALRDEMRGIIMEFPWIDIVLGIMSGSALCFGIKMLDLRSFYVLMLGTIVFFASYFVGLLFRKNEIVLNMMNSLLSMINNIQGAKHK